uniref:5.6 kDa salivary protein n=1 Tax=Phlebotomus orientalis TaxID=99786 RepID=V5K5N8_PHLOR|nr:5.6 kDa salivary protein [Phlebotomus orientalis]
MKKIVLFCVIFVALVIIVEAIPTKSDDPDATKGRNVARAEPGQQGQVPVEPEFVASKPRNRKNRRDRKNN